MEVNRIDHSMQKILFSLAEQKTPQGDHLPNVYVIAAINHGDAYDLDIEISDIALKRRFAFIEFDPELENFRTEGLHPMVVETKNYMTSSRDIIDTNLKDADKVFEQATTYGSWVSYSDYLYQLEAEFAEETGVDDYKLSYEEAGNDVTTTAGPLFFKGETTQKIADIFFMLENTKSFDFEKIIAGGKVNKNDWAGGKYSENDIVTRTYYAIREKILNEIAFMGALNKASKLTNGVTLIKFMVENKKTGLFMALLQDINGMFEKERTALKDLDDKAAKKSIDMKQMSFVTASVAINKFLETSKDPELKEVSTKVKQIAELSKSK